MNRVTSKDGTRIAFDRTGTGPTLILVGGGGAVDRSENAPLAEELANDFTVPLRHLPGRAGAAQRVQQGAACASRRRPQGRGVQALMRLAGFFDDAADAIVATIPNAERDVIPQEGHVADPKVVAPLLRRFFDICPSR